MQLELATSTLIGFCLALVRTTAWIIVCPPFNTPAVPGRVRVGLATAISFVIAQQIGSGGVSLELGPFVLALLSQALAGFALGFSVLILFSAIQAAGELIDLQVGFSMASILDPMSGTNAAPIGRFHQLLALAIVFSINGHVLIVRGYLRSVEAIPMGGLDFARFSEQLVGLLGMFLVAALEISLPVLAALFCTEVALGLLGKAAPQLNILVIGMAAKTMVAFSLLGITLVLLPESTESLLTQAIRSAAAAFGG